MFYNNTYLENVVIGPKLTYIEPRMFYGCTNLKKIEFLSRRIDDKLEIGEESFYNCTSLSSITLPEGLTSIGPSAFGNCKSANMLILPSTLESIGKRAFYGSFEEQGFSELVFPTSMRNFGEFIFGENKNIKKLTIEGNGSEYSLSMMFGLEEVIIGKTVRTLSDNMFISSPIQKIEFVDRTTNNPLTIKGAFKALSLDVLKLPLGTDSIGKRAFYDSSINLLELPNSVKYIDSEAIGRVHKMIIPKSIEGISLNAFSYSHVDTLYYNARNAKGHITPHISELIIGKDVEAIADDFFSMPPSIIRNISFETRESKPLEIGNRAFCGAHTNELNLPLGVISIGEKAFSNCEIQKIVISSTVSQIGKYAFDNSLNNFQIVNYQPNPLGIWEDIMAEDKYGMATLYVPTDSKYKYETAAIWCKFKNIEEFDVLTIIANSYNLKYGDELPELNYTIRGGSINGIPAISCEATKLSSTGTYPIIITRGNIIESDVTYVNGTLTIEKAPLTITAKSYTIKQGDALPTFEASYEGFKNNETFAVLTKQPSITTTATSASAPGVYDITISGAEAQNYEISYVAGKLTIEAVEITPITGSEETSFKETISNETDLENTVIDNTYYNMDAARGDGYDATEQALVLNSTTSDAQMTAIQNAEVGDAAVKENYSGIIFEIPAGKGTITVDAKTVGTHVLNVQVGNSAPTKVQKSERGTADVEYNVNAPTYVYLYASTQSGSAARLDRAGTAGANSVLLYGYTVTIGGTGIQLIDKGKLAIDNYYDLSGRKVNTPRKGVYIINGRKVVIK